MGQKKYGIYETEDWLENYASYWLDCERGKTRRNSKACQQTDSKRIAPKCYQEAASTKALRHEPGRLPKKRRMIKKSRKAGKQSNASRSSIPNHLLVTARHKSSRLDFERVLFATMLVFIALSTGFTTYQVAEQLHKNKKIVKVAKARI